jgi:hypothetical protein
MKFAVRSVQKLRGGTSLSTAGDSTAPTTDQLPTLRGDRAPTGEDPVEFLTRLGARVSAEGKHVQDLFTAVVEKARTSGADEFDEDPAAVLANTKQLEEIATTLPVEKGAYVKKLWQTWLENYAYKAVEGEVKDQVRRKLKKKIDKAASSVGENGDDWLRDFGGVSERKAKEDAAKQPKRPANPFGYG